MVANEAEGRAEAIRRIAACRDARAEELDLGGLQLTALDGEVLAALCQLIWLKRLFLGPSAEARENLQIAFIDGERNPAVCNTLATLPDSLFEALTRLEQLDLTVNRVRSLPRSIARLGALSLNLSYNDMDAEAAQSLAGLVNLASLDLSSNKIGADGAEALKQLFNLTSLNLTSNDIGDEGAKALEGLVNLTNLYLLGNKIGKAGAQALKGLINLAVLDLTANDIGDDGVKALGGLVNLTSLDLFSNGIGSKGAQALRGLVNLTHLELMANDIKADGAQALKNLVNLTSLNLCGNGIGADGVRALDRLVNLTDLNLASNEIGDEGAQALKDLINLTSLDLSDNNIGDEGAQALKDLVNLTNLDLSDNNIDAGGTQPLGSLVDLTNLNLARNRIGNEGAQALKNLVDLTDLELSDCGLGAVGARALMGFAGLTSLDLSDNNIGDEGARALKDLVNITYLDLSNSGIRDISPLVSLRNLQNINLSGCHLDHNVPEFWMLPSLERATLHNARLPQVPHEILSRREYDNCLDRLRAHLSDLTGDGVAVSDVKLMILGNGRIGKTQISRRLRGEGFDESVPSTHGIEVRLVPLAPEGTAAPAMLKIWDFGGQDIYHGTHALFLKSRAIFMLVWTPQSEAEQFHIHDGFTFRNQPLAYWLAYVRTFSGVGLPVLVIQSRCDRPGDDINDPPLPPGALDAFACRKLLHYSAKGDGTRPRGHAALKEALLEAVQWMHDNEGVVRIGPGRAAVKTALEEKLAAGQRLIAYQDYLGLCAEVERTGKGRISDPALLLDYLHNIGTVFCREGLFDNQIILDQAWVLEAVYALLDRASQSFEKITRNRGRFRRSELAEWVWQAHSGPEQELFLSFMQQCGICFTIRKGEKGDEAEYIAPDFLPERSDDETRMRLKLWDDGRPGAEAVLTFALLPPALMRALITRIGRDAGLAAEYWRDGVYFFDEMTDSRALVEQRRTNGWAGEVHIATRGRNAGLLVQRLIKLIGNDRISLGARPIGTSVTGDEAKIEAREAADAPGAKDDEVTVRPVHEPSSLSEYYVSYAWGDITEGKERDSVVERLCMEAEARGKRVIRDNNAIKNGDRISTFMDRIGRGAVNGLVCIILSDNYLKSPYCMHELFSVWDHSRADADTFVARTRVFLLPSARIETAIERTDYVDYWQNRLRQLDALIMAKGLKGVSDQDFAEGRLMGSFVNWTANILHLVQDTLRPRTFNDYVNHVFE